MLPFGNRCERADASAKLSHKQLWPFKPCWHSANGFSQHSVAKQEVLFTSMMCWRCAGWSADLHLTAHCGCSCLFHSYLLQLIRGASSIEQWCAVVWKNVLWAVQFRQAGEFIVFPIAASQVTSTVWWGLGTKSSLGLKLILQIQTDKHACRSMNHYLQSVNS